MMLRDAMHLPTPVLDAADRAAVGVALRSSFAAALNELLYVTAGLAIFGALGAVLLIRQDFHRPGDPQPAPPGTPGRPTAEETV
jgi:hypothetical protein